MTRSRRARLARPAFSVFSGSAIATAFGIRLGWKFAVIAEAVTLMAAAVLYLVGKDDTDAGAILSNRADERQRLVNLRAGRLASLVAACSLVVAFVIAVALKKTYWPFEVLYLVTVIAYCAGLGLYGAQDAVGTADADREERRVAS
jgi:hypothetical protein